MPLPQPRAYADAAMVLANQAAYANRPSLIRLARQVTEQAKRCADTSPRPLRKGGAA